MIQQKSQFQVSPECIYLQKVIQIARLQVYHGRQNMCGQLHPANHFCHCLQPKMAIMPKAPPNTKIPAQK